VPSRKPSLAIIGAGRVGRALGRALQQRGWRIGAVVTCSQKSARAAVRAIGAGQSHSRLDATIADADIILVTTPDRTIAPVAAQLAALVARVTPPHHAASVRNIGPASPRKIVGGGPEALTWAMRIVQKGSVVGRGFNRDKKKPVREGLQPLAGKIILHTNGALDHSALAPLERLGAVTGSLHPLQTFGRGEPPQLAGCICAIEGDPRALRAARRIARELGCVPVKIAAKDKPAYHAAGALAAGHILAVIEAATRILMASGFTRKQAVRALLPLTRQTLTNFEKLGANAAWTGPLARGDFATVRKHEAALRKFPGEYRDAYQAISRLSLRVLRHQ
jgi:predicted short-subunit dehydrogenase-like oxidoreductase (DUF2520 family)